MLTVTRAAMLGLALLIPPAASAQSEATAQLWGNLTLDWHKSPRITYSFDLEPKALVSGPPDEPGWANIELTPSAEFAATKWIDLSADVGR
jgi:hypothetical protein